MPSFAFARADNINPTTGPAVFTATPTGTTITSAGQVTTGVGILQGQVNLAAASSGQVAVCLPYGAAVGSPIMVTNTAGTATALTVFPPCTAQGTASAAAAGGTIYGTAAASANTAVSISQYKSATFWPHPNGIDFTVVIGA